jgi:hypothetical protein
MNQIFKQKFLYAIFVSLLLFFSCSKGEKSSINDNEITLYESNIESKMVDSRIVFLGGNTKKLTKIEFNNSSLQSLINSENWKDETENLVLKKSEIRKTYLHSSPIEIISIPLGGNGIQFLNIYALNNNYLITKFVEIQKSDGIKTYEIRSIKDELYYKFDVNNANQMGNWFFNKEIPFSQVFKTNTRTITPRHASYQQIDKPCNERPFDACMSCFIAEVCGSDWKCMIACGAFLPSCVAGAAAACILL